MKRKLLLLSLPLIAAASYLVFNTVAEADSDGLTWRPCDDYEGVECASVPVPRNWNDPDGPRIDISVVKHDATDPKHRVGSLFYNPGGPGVPVAGFLSEYADQTFSPALLAKFDIIGIDPRGVGDSEQIHCDQPVHDPRVTEYPHSEAEYDQLVTRNAEVAAGCDDLIGHVDTTSTAKDFDAVRAAMGESKISFFGKSYGTLLGTSYAEQFPDRIQAMVLDGVVDHTKSSDDLVMTASAAVETSFDDFVSWCDSSSECALHGRDVAALWDDLLARADESPIPVDDQDPMTAEELTMSMYAALGLVPEIAGPLSVGLAQAVDDDNATGFADIRQESLYNPDSTAAYRSIMCHEFAPGLDGYDAVADRLARAEAVAPHMRATSEFWDSTVGCLGWPVGPDNPQHPVDIDDSAPPILLVGNTGDPATPVEWAHGLSDQIAGSEVLTYDGAGHTAYLRSDCVSGYVDDYLLSGTMPAADTVCTE